MESVEEIMTKEVIYAKVPGTREEVLQLFKETGHSGFPCIKQEDDTSVLIGIVTRTDLMEKPSENQLALLMTRDVNTVHPKTSIIEAANILLNNPFRRLPVISDKELVGIVTVYDLVNKFLPKSKIHEPIMHFFERELVAVYEGTPISVALEIMKLANVQALCVLDDDSSLSGIVTDADVLSVAEVSTERKMSDLSAATEGEAWSWDASSVLWITTKELKLPKNPVRDVAIKQVVTAFEQAPVIEIAKKMRK